MRRRAGVLGPFSVVVDNFVYVHNAAIHHTSPRVAAGTRGHHEAESHWTNQGGIQPVS